MSFEATNNKFTNIHTIKVLSLHDKESPLFGTDLESKASVLYLQSWANSEMMVDIVNIIQGLLGRVPYNKKVVDASIKNLDVNVAFLEERLAEYTYLVGERLTLADLFVASCFYRMFTLTFGKEWRAEHPIFMRWINTVYKSEYLAYWFDQVKFVDEPVQPPKKESKKESKKADAPKKEKKAAEPAADAPPAEEKKPKHPLELLGKPTIALDELKRAYSNMDTRKGALPYFWDTFFNPEEYSLWKVEYKYNDELTQCFMSNNLIGGFFNRLTGSIKYMFGCCVVYGENDNNGIIGAMLVRGQDFAPAFDVAPDWESYSYTKLDPTTQETKDFVNNMWAWDEPVIINGEKKDIVDGKVMK